MIFSVCGEVTAKRIIVRVWLTSMLALL